MGFGRMGTSCCAGELTSRRPRLTLVLRSQKGTEFTFGSNLEDSRVWIPHSERMGTANQEEPEELGLASVPEVDLSSTCILGNLKSPSD